MKIERIHVFPITTDKNFEQIGKDINAFIKDHAKSSFSALEETDFFFILHYTEKS